MHYNRGMCEIFEDLKWMLEPDLREGCPFAGSCAGNQSRKKCQMLKEVSTVDAKSEEKSDDLPLAY